MISGKKFELIKPGTLYKVRATCSFAPNEDCINEEGHIYASDGIIELKKNTILMFIDAKYKFCDWNQLRGQQMVIFKFITDEREVYLPIQANYKTESEFNNLIKCLFELYLKNIDNTVEPSSS